jgi:hypothetical protein
MFSSSVVEIKAWDYAKLPIGGFRFLGYLSAVGRFFVLYTLSDGVLFKSHLYTKKKFENISTAAISGY